MVPLPSSVDWKDGTGAVATTRGHSHIIIAMRAVAMDSSVQEIGARQRAVERFKEALERFKEARAASDAQEAFFRAQLLGQAPSTPPGSPPPRPSSKPPDSQQARAANKRRGQEAAARIAARRRVDG